MKNDGLCLGCIESIILRVTFKLKSIVSRNQRLDSVVYHHSYYFKIPPSPNIVSWRSRLSGRPLDFHYTRLLSCYACYAKGSPFGWPDRLVYPTIRKRVASSPLSACFMALIPSSPSSRHYPCTFQTLATPSHCFVPLYASLVYGSRFS